MSAKRRRRTGVIVTKGRLSRWQREQRWRHITIIAGSIIVAIVLIAFGYGYYDSEIKPYHQTILKVNDTSFDMNYYIDMLRLHGIKGDEDQSRQQSIARNTLESIKRNEMYRQLAPKLGITVTEGAIDKQIKKRFSSPNQKKDNSMSYEDYIKKLEETGVSENLFREQVSASLLARKIREHIGDRRVPEEMKQAHVQGILVESEDKLKKLQAKLESGEDFASLAGEFSEDPSKENGGDLGWLPRDIITMKYNEELTDVAFGLQPGELSEPIKVGSSDDTKSYWLVKVLERKKRPLEESYKRILQSQAFSKWFAEKQKEFHIEKHLDSDMRDWAIQKAVG